MGVSNQLWQQEKRNLRALVLLNQKRHQGENIDEENPVV